MTRRHIIDQLADTTPITHLDFTPPCDNDQCDQAAHWILWRVQCCPDVPVCCLLCEPCRAVLWRMWMGQCTYCSDHTFIPARRAFWRVEPLERTRGGT